MPHPNNGKNQLDIQKQNFKLNFSRKIHKQFLETHQTLKILDVAISSHLIFFFFLVLLISGHFQTTQENQNWSIRSRKISCNWGKGGFPIISKGQAFRTDQKKSLLRYKYCWASISNYVYDTIVVITKIYIFLLYFTLVLLLIMRSRPASIGWTVTFAAAPYHCCSYTEYLFYDIDVLYIFDVNIVWPYEICEFIWFLIW